jgi:hypothetical protein
MAVSASCVLKYMWWTACYSAWNGIPKLAERWKMAGARASAYGWSFLLLEAVVILTLFSVFRLRLAARLGLALLITAPVTAAFALFLSLTQIGVR